MPGKVFIDSNVWLYALLRGPADDPRDETAARLIADCPGATISTQVIREVSANLLKKGRFTEQRLRQTISAWYAEQEVIEIEETQLLRASHLREAVSISYWDSLIVAAALRAGLRHAL